MSHTLHTLRTLQASDFGAVYEKLLAEFTIATKLSAPDRLGRTVTSLAPAECVIGLTEGVKEHDHERLSDALANADKMGLASRLAAPMKAARERYIRRYTSLHLVSPRFTSLHPSLHA